MTGTNKETYRFTAEKLINPGRNSSGRVRERYYDFVWEFDWKGKPSQTIIDESYDLLRQRIVNYPAEEGFELVIDEKSREITLKNYSELNGADLLKRAMKQARSEVIDGRFFAGKCAVPLSKEKILDSEFFEERMMTPLEAD